MSLVGFEHVFETAQPVPFAPNLTLKVIPSTTLMLLKIVAYMDDQPRRAKDLEDIRGLLAEYEADSERVFSEIVIDAELEDYGLAPAFLMGMDLRALCNPLDSSPLSLLPAGACTQSRLPRQVRRRLKATLPATPTYLRR